MNIRNLPTDNFTIIRNGAMEDTRLSWRAKGLLTYMRSRPETWEFNLAHLTTVSEDGRDATRVGLQELERAGYLAKTPKNDPITGRLMGWEWVVSDDPDAVAAVLLKTRTTVNPSDGISHTSKTEGSKTEISKTEEVQDLSPSEVLDLVVRNRTLASRAAGYSDPLLEIWNDNCGSLPQARVLTGVRRKRFSALRKELGAEVEGIFRAAVMEVAGDRFWQEKPYGLDNLLVDGRVVEKAEKHVASRGVSGGDRRLAGTAKAIADAIGGL